eukprot:15119412-Alexandrium_andersonii.AAC.1
MDGQGQPARGGLAEDHRAAPDGRASSTQIDWPYAAVQQCWQVSVRCLCARALRCVCVPLRRRAVARRRVALLCGSRACFPWSPPRSDNPRAARPNARERVKKWRAALARAIAQPHQAPRAMSGFALQLAVARSAA